MRTLAFVFPLLAVFGVVHGAGAGVRPNAARPPAQDHAVKPDAESAEKNAHQIFNELNNAGRQWGSSFKHNGVGFFPTILPAGALLYHGGVTDQPPNTLEWLAFEVEHAEAFANSWLVGPYQPGDDDDEAANGQPDQKPLSSRPQRPDPRAQVNVRGYFQTYQANRDIKLLYVDGMAAAKTNAGTLDSQDLVLCENKIGNLSLDNFFGEMDRTQRICDMLRDYDYHGYIRMEIGYEVVYCDFYDGALDLLSARRTYYTKDKAGDDGLQDFQWTRAVAERYDGLGTDRLKIDFSSMVSGWFYPINLTNTDPERPDLPRFASTEQKHLNAIKGHVVDILTQPRRFTVDWQAATDMIVQRYANRLAHMASPNISQIMFINELETATLTHVEAPSLPDDINVMARDDATGTELKVEIERCTQHLLLPAKAYESLWEHEDQLIYTALKTVTLDICTTLQSIRVDLFKAAPEKQQDHLRIDTTKSNDELAKAVAAARKQARSLTERLEWSEWRKTRRCGVDEVMFVPMWPTGQIEDYYNPGCRNSQYISLRPDTNSYWGKYRL